MLIGWTCIHLKGAFMQKFVAFVAVAVIVWLLVALNGPSHPRASAPTAPPTPKAFDACVMSHVFIKDQLKAPATADFADCNDPETYVAHLAGNAWKVSSYVDAQNSFGALLRSDYTTMMRYEPSTDRWTLTDFSLVNR